jgi:hypothetical protein
VEDEVEPLVKFGIMIIQEVLRRLRLRLMDGINLKLGELKVVTIQGVLVLQLEMGLMRKERFT